MIRQSRPKFAISGLPRPKLNIFRPSRPKFDISRLCRPRQGVRDRRDRNKDNRERCDRIKISRSGRKIRRSDRKIRHGCHYEAKLGILCFVSGFHNRPTSDLSENAQFCYFFSIFFIVSDSTNKYLSHCTAQICSENEQFCGKRNRTCGIQNSLWNPQTSNKTFVLLN